MSMFSKIVEKINTFGDHHQTLFAVIIAFAIICCSWGVEKILEEYVFPHKPLYGYIATIMGGLLLLWLTKHFILHVI